MNIDITADEMGAIRSLDDFDLTMLLSETHDHGWPSARILLPDILAALAAIERRKGKK